MIDNLPTSLWTSRSVFKFQHHFTINWVLPVKSVHTNTGRHIRQLSIQPLAILFHGYIISRAPQDIPVQRPTGKFGSIVMVSSYMEKTLQLPQLSRSFSRFYQTPAYPTKTFLWSSFKKRGCAPSTCNQYNPQISPRTGSCLCQAILSPPLNAVDSGSRSGLSRFF